MHVIKIDVSFSKYPFSHFCLTLKCKYSEKNIIPIMFKIGLFCSQICHLCCTVVSDTYKWQIATIYLKQGRHNKIVFIKCKKKKF